MKFTISLYIGQVFIFLNGIGNVYSQFKKAETPPPFTLPKKFITPNTTIPRSCGKRQTQSSRIIGGTNSKAGDWPWQVSLFNYGAFKCGGVLISPQWILTAAHCTYKTNPLFVEILVGDYNLFAYDQGEMKIKAEQIINYPSFRYPTLHSNDISLIKLKKPVPFSKYIQPACLPFPKKKLEYQKKCYLTGWGDPMNPGFVTSLLQQTSLQILNYTECSIKNKKITPIEDTMFCGAIKAPALKNNSGCHGDSGGGIVCLDNQGSWELTGVLSWGSRYCKTSDAYSVFTKVSSFRLWIDHYITAKSKVISVG